MAGVLGVDEQRLPKASLLKGRVGTRTCRLIVPSRLLKSQYRSGDLVLANDNIPRQPQRKSEQGCYLLLNVN